MNAPIAPLVLVIPVARHHENQRIRNRDCILCCTDFEGLGTHHSSAKFPLKGWKAKVCRSRKLVWTQFAYFMRMWIYFCNSKKIIRLQWTLCKSTWQPCHRVVRYYLTEIIAFILSNCLQQHYPLTRGRMPKKVVYILVFCLMILSMTSVYDILGTSLGYLGFLLSERTSGFSAIISLNKFPSKILLKFFNVNSFLLSVTSHAKCPGAIFPPPIICHFLAVNGSKFYKNMKNLMSPEVFHTYKHIPERGLDTTILQSLSFQNKDASYLPAFCWQICCSTMWGVMHCGISSSLMVSDIGVLGFRKIIRIIRRLSFLQSITDMDIYCLLGRFGKVWFWGFGCLVCFGVG